MSMCTWFDFTCILSCILCVQCLGRLLLFCKCMYWNLLLLLSFFFLLLLTWIVWCDEAITLPARSDIEAVITSVLDSIFYSKGAEPGLGSHQDIIEIFVNAATFLKEVEGCNEHGMSFGDFKSWCSLLPSLKKFLGNMLMPPGPGFFLILPFPIMCMHCVCCWTQFVTFWQ